MSRSRRSILAVSPLEDRITPAYDPTSVANFVRAERIVVSANTKAVGAVFNTWEDGGPASDPQQRLADPREAGLAVEGLLLSGNETTPGDNLATAQRYIQWYLLNVDASTNYVIQQQWYRNSGGFVRTTAPTSEAPYIAVFLNTAWDYVRLGGDQTLFSNPSFRSKILSLMTVLLADQQSDNLFVSTAGDTKKYLADNSEIYAGLLSASRLMTVVYADSNRAFQYDNAAVRLRDAVKLLMYGGPATGYGWVKDGTNPVTTTDDAANPWVTQAVRLYPAIYGLEDPRGTRMTGQLDLLNRLWSGGARDWVTRIVDVNENPWTVTGFAQDLISGDTTKGNLHNDFIYDSRFQGNPLRPVNPLTAGDAGWMLRTPGPFNLPPAAAAQSITLDQGTSVPVTLTGTDPDGNPLRYTIVKPPAHGSFAGSDANTTYSTNNAFTYTPTATYSGNDTILFKVSDGIYDSDYVAVSFAVNATASPPVTPPTVPGVPTVPGLPPVVLPPTVPPGTPPTTPPVVPTVPGVPVPVPQPPPSLQDILVSSPTGGGAVTIVTAIGTVRTSLFPLGANQPGGVRATLVDLNGDGTPDYLAGSGPGVASLVGVVNGSTGEGLFRVAPFEPAFTGGVFVATADLTGDGTPDVAVTADQGGGPRVRVFNGRTFAVVADFFGIDDPSFRGGARVSFGDVTGDGVPDLIVAAGFGGGPRVTVWDGTSVRGGAPRQVANFFAFEPGLRNGVYVAAGNFIGSDGRADLVTGAGPGGGPRVSVFSGTTLGQTNARSIDFFSGDPSERGGVSVAVKPGTAGDTLVTGAGASAAVSRVRSYSAAALTTRPAAPGASFEVEPIDGNAAGVYVG